MPDTRYYGADGKLKWGYPVDVGHLILQLQTLDASMKVSAVTHIEIGGRTRARAFGLSMSRERWDEGGWLNYLLPGPEALAIWASTRDEGLEGLSSLEQQVESLRAELARANEDLAQHSENWRVKAGHLEDERHGLRAANEATWSELVKRGLASEIGPGKLRSLRADSKIHAECEKRNAELTEDRDAFKLAMESCQEDVLRFHTSLEETEGQRDALLADKERGSMESYVKRQEEWSSRTFGHGVRTLGVTRHIEKEITEIRLKPHDLTEWIDVIILALDGYWRHGGDPLEIMIHLQAKQDKNFARQWPWPPPPEDQPSEHIEVAGNPLLKSTSERTNGCYCRPGECRAPAVMGTQMPCLDPEKAARKPVSQDSEVRPK